MLRSFENWDDDDDPYEINMIESVEDVELLQPDLPESLETCVAHSKDETYLIINEALKVPIFEILLDKTPISDVNTFVMQELKELVIDLPTERLNSESVEVEDPLQPIQKSEKEEDVKG